jgi:hypothetical protein
MELFTATGKLKKFFFDSYRCSMCAPWVTRHTSIRYSSSCHTHAWTWVHRYSSLLQWHVPLGQRGHVAMVGRILCTKCTLHSNHRLIRVTFQHTKRLLSRSGHFLTIHSHRLAAKMWTTMKNNLLGGKTFWVLLSICTGFVNTCPTVFL